MINQPFYIILLTTIVLQQTRSSGPNQIIEFFRHGARGPVFDNERSWVEKGILTSIGMRQHYILGEILAQKYPDLIGTTYDYNEIYMLSSNVPRCIQSAGAQLYGMYNGKGPSLAANYPREQAIPPSKDADVIAIANTLSNDEALPNKFLPGVINVADETNIYIFKGDASFYCPRISVWTRENKNDAQTQQTFQIFQDTVNNLNKLLGVKAQIKSPGDLLPVVDSLLVNMADNRVLPFNISDPALISNMTWAFTWFFYHFGQGQQISREMASFNMIDAFLEQLSSFREGKNYNKAALYSGHDNNIMALLGALGIINEDCIMENFYSVIKTGKLVHPECHFSFFASSVITEFYNETETPYVKMFYNNVPLKICGGKYECPYYEFIVFAKSAGGNNTRESYLAKCAVPDASDEITENVLIQTSTNVSLAVVLLLLVVKLLWDRKRHLRQMKFAKDKINFYEKLQSGKSTPEVIEVEIQI